MKKLGFLLLIALLTTLFSLSAIAEDLDDSIWKITIFRWEWGANPPGPYYGDGDGDGEGMQWRLRSWTSVLRFYDDEFVVDYLFGPIPSLEYGPYKADPWRGRIRWTGILYFGGLGAKDGGDGFPPIANYRFNGVATGGRMRGQILEDTLGKQWFFMADKL